MRVMWCGAEIIQAAGVVERAPAGVCIFRLEHEPVSTLRSVQEAIKVFKGRIEVSVSNDACCQTESNQLRLMFSDQRRSVVTLTLVDLVQRYSTFFYLSTLFFWSGPKQSRTPYHCLTHGYYKDKVKTSAVYHIPFIFDRHMICDLPQHPLKLISAPQVKKPCISVTLGWSCKHFTTNDGLCKITVSECVNDNAVWELRNQCSNHDNVRLMIWAKQGCGSGYFVNRFHTYRYSS